MIPGVSPQDYFVALSGYLSKHGLETEIEEQEWLSVIFATEEGVDIWLSEDHTRFETDTTEFENLSAKVLFSEKVTKLAELLRRVTPASLITPVKEKPPEQPMTTSLDLI